MKYFLYYHDNLFGFENYYANDGSSTWDYKLIKKCSLLEALCIKKLDNKWKIAIFE